MFSTSDIKEFMFVFTNFVVDPDRYELPARVADKILRKHMLPMVPLRLQLDAALWPSKKSCYRPKEYEKLKGRTPDKTASGRWSQHTFDEADAPDGATDWTSTNLLKLGRLLTSELCPYKRVAIYPDKRFYHCDHYGATELTFQPDKRLYYDTDWNQISEKEFITKIEKAF